MASKPLNSSNEVKNSINSQKKIVRNSIEKTSQGGTVKLKLLST